MKNILTIATIAGVLLSSTACSTLRFPGVHRITVQQGNVITQSMIDKLRPGMTKSQVRYVLGNPIVVDPLTSERWDYVYLIQVPGYDPIQKTLQVFFVDERLSYFEGDFAPSEVINPEASNAAD